jgi:hypothetical protein
MHLLPFDPYREPVPAFCHDFLAVRGDGSDRIDSVL